MKTSYEISQDSNILGSLLLVLFIGLKLGGVINWSWFWVLSPLLIPVFIVLTVFAILGILELITYITEK